MTPDARTEAEALLAAVEKMIPGTWNAEAIAALYRTTMDNAAGIVALRNDAPGIIRALLDEVDAAVAERDAARALAFDAVGHLQHTLACTGDRAWNLDLCDCYVRRFEERLAALTGAKP